MQSSFSLTDESPRKPSTFHVANRLERNGTHARRGLPQSFISREENVILELCGCALSVATGWPGETCSCRRVSYSSAFACSLPFPLPFPFGVSFVNLRLAPFSNSWNSIESCRFCQLCHFSSNQWSLRVDSSTETCRTGCLSASKHIPYIYRDTFYIYIYVYIYSIYIYI